MGFERAYPSQWTKLTGYDGRAPLGSGSMAGLTIEGRQILIGRVGVKFYVMDAIRSHLLGYLPKGQI